MVKMGQKFRNLIMLGKRLNGDQVVVYQKGGRIVAYCDSMKLSTNGNLELLLQRLAGAEVIHGETAIIYPPLKL